MSSNGSQGSTSHGKKLSMQGACKEAAKESDRDKKPTTIVMIVGKDVHVGVHSSPIHSSALADKDEDTRG